jgi:hypothetical protein
MLHFADGMHAGDGTAILDCHELQQAIHDDIVNNLLLSMWDADAPEPRIDKPSAKIDRKTKNRLSARRAREADKQYVKLLLTDLDILTETFERYVDYIMQLKVHATKAVDSMAVLEAAHARNKVKIAMLQPSDVVNALPTLVGVPTKDRNRIHAKTSRQRKRDYMHEVMKQRDESWSTLEDVVLYTTDLESRCSVLHDFDDTGCILLQLTETRQRLLMRTSAHKQRCEELQSRLSYRAIHRE